MEEGFPAFNDTLREGIALSVIEGLKQGFIDDQLTPLISQAFMQTENRPTLADTINAYSLGEIDLATASMHIEGMFSDLDATMTTIEPLVNTFNTGLNDLSTTLGLNTDALLSNTAAILGPVESFLRELTVGQYAPALSLEGMQAEYNKLYQSAFYDPDAFSAYASPNQVTWIS